MLASPWYPQVVAAVSPSYPQVVAAVSPPHLGHLLRHPHCEADLRFLFSLFLNFPCLSPLLAAAALADVA
jgi:hypothetical protein